MDRQASAEKKLLRESVTLRVPFHDVDPAQVVWHGNYYKYFEHARCALLEQIQYNYNHMAQSGLVWPVVECSARYIKPIRYDQLIQVEAILTEWDYRIDMDYQVRSMDDELLTTGKTSQVPLDAKTWELVLGSPPVLLENVSAAMEALS